MSLHKPHIGFHQNICKIGDLKIGLSPDKGFCGLVPFCITPSNFQFFDMFSIKTKRKIVWVFYYNIKNYIIRYYK